MSITDELREWAEEFWEFAYSKFGDKSELLAIADRIDAEHKAALLNVHTDLMDASGWVRLPKDADGEYINIGDVVEWIRYEDDDPTIVRNVSAVGNGVFFAWSDEQGRYAQYEAHAYRHRHAPTVEDVLREFSEKMNENLGMYTGEAIDADEWRSADAKTIAEYAAKLRLAEGEDA